VTVSIGDREAEGLADGDGRWRVDLPAMESGGPFEMTVTSGAESVALSDVLIGDVWLCSGQSNMDFKLQNADGAEQALADTTKHSRIRLFKVERHVAETPQEDCKGAWRTNTPENAKDITAVGYFFGLKLNQELDVPIGLIHSAYGGTPAEAWTSEDALRTAPGLGHVLVEMAEKRLAYVKAMAKWEKEARAMSPKHIDPPPMPAPPFYTNNRHMPTGLYNGMIHPLIPYGIRGVIWYQGESNVWRSHQYRTLLPTMIEDWRGRWDDAELPFGIVQLTSYFDPRFPPAEWSWPELREAQLMAARSDPHTGLVVTIDVGNPTDVHPTNKKTIGERLAQWALGTTYGRDLVPSGPLFKKAAFEGEKVIIEFDHAGSGLATRDGGPVRGVVISNDSGKFRWATAEIRGDILVVTSDRYDDPTSVRYGWADNPDWANLINKEGLPASPFRTDDWPGITEPGD
jgi:sialate O-acetylesterase